MNAVAAWQQSITQIVDQYRSLEDPYLQQRAADVVDVGNQVLLELAGEAAAAPVKFSHPVILVAEELTVTQTAQLDLEQVEGVVTLLGGPTSHSAILARSLGIPAITGVPVSVLRLPDETPIALDGASGALWIEPPEVTRTRLENERQRWLEGRQKLLESSHDPAVTRDGHHIDVVANVGNLQDAQAAAKNGAEGIGLLRTEFLFLTRETPPDEDEQYQAVVDIANEMGGQPVIVRTLDVGGDKALPYIDLPDEANPFLGVRAIRLSLRRPDLFSTQLRAILRAGENANLRIMFPMVAEKSEVTQARIILNDVHQTLENEGIAHSWPVETGIMVEVPSVAMLAPALAEEVDFFSIGTNDLTQYTLAAERGNPELTAFADGLHPAVLHLIRRVVKAAHKQGKWVGVCGELAGDPTAVPVLVGLGVDELSMNAVAIPQAKAIIRSLQLTDAQLLASQLLDLTDAPTARQQADEFLNVLEF
jgi:phosphoenolpyruvate-protein phosphotransferase